MTTVRNVIEDALDILGVTGIDFDADGTSVSKALRAYNTMISGFEGRGFDEAHTPAAANDAVAIGEQYVDGLSFALAKRLAPVMRKSLSAEATRQAEHWENVLHGALRTPVEVTTNGGLSFMPSRKYTGFC